MPTAPAPRARRPARHLRPTRPAVLLLPALLLLAAAPAASRAQQADAPRALPYLAVELDDLPARIGDVYLDNDSYLVSVNTAVSRLLRGRAALRVADGYAYVASGGRDIVRIPIGDRHGFQALYYRPGGDTRPVELYEPAREAPLPGKGPQLLMDLQTLAGLFGVAMTTEPGRIRLYTPEYWCRLLGVNPDGRALKNLSLLPAAGISAPANPLLLWMRPAAAVHAQFYNLSDGAPEPMLGYRDSPHGRDWVEYPRGDEETPAARTAPANVPLRATAKFDKERGQVGLYAIVLTRDDPPGGDPLKAIRAGQIADEDWCVVGLRQNVAQTPIRFEVVAVQQDDTTLKKLAAIYKMDVGLLARLNGFPPDAETAARPLPKGEEVAVVLGFDDDRRRTLNSKDWRYVGRLYAVRAGDRLATLAKMCGVTPEQFTDANPTIPDGAELVPGELVELVAGTPHPVPVDAPIEQPGALPNPALAASEYRETSGRGRVKERTTLLQAPDGSPLRPLYPGNSVTVYGQVGAMYRVNDGGGDGYVSASAVRLLAPLQQPLPGPDPGGNVVIQTALRYRGTPYVWGGNSLQRGIDCSHFVAAAFSWAGERVPEAPVHHQEAYGDIVHRKAGAAESDGRPLPYQPETQPLSNLHTGDRLIFQTNPVSNFDGNHHTAIYIGRYAPYTHAFVHASSHGVTVSDLRPGGGYWWGRYRYAVRGAQPRYAELPDPAHAARTRVASAPHSATRTPTHVARATEGRHAR